MSAKKVGFIEVDGKAAVTTPEFTLLVTETAPATEKKLAPTPLKVKPVFGLKLIKAV